MLHRMFVADLACSRHHTGYESECEGCKALRRADAAFAALDDQRAAVMKDLVAALTKRIIVVTALK